jgi:uncharacterized integral membrane protein
MITDGGEKVAEIVVGRLVLLFLLIFAVNSTGDILVSLVDHLRSIINKILKI